MKKKLFIILTSVLMLSLVLVGIVNAEKGPTVLLDGPSKPEEEEIDELICSYEMTHPVLKSLAEHYQVIYEDLVNFFCMYDLGVGDIKHALTTAAIFDDEEITYETLLAMVYDEGMEWGEIWQELGLIGPGEFGPGDDEDDDQDDEEGENGLSPVCSGEMDHPVLLRLAEEYDVDYETLLAYFCMDGFGIGEIKNALKVGAMEDIDKTWEDLLGEREDEENDQKTGWGLIWQRLGLIGNDKMEDEPEEIENQFENKNDKGKPENHPGKGKGLDKKP